MQTILTSFFTPGAARPTGKTKSLSTRKRRINQEDADERVQPQTKDKGKRRDDAQAASGSRDGAGASPSNPRIKPRASRDPPVRKAKSSTSTVASRGGGTVTPSRTPETIGASFIDLTLEESPRSRKAASSSTHTMVGHLPTPPNTSMKRPTPPSPAKNAVTHNNRKRFRAAAPIEQAITPTTAFRAVQLPTPWTSDRADDETEMDNDTPLPSLRFGSTYATSSLYSTPRGGADIPEQNPFLVSPRSSSLDVDHPTQPQPDSEAALPRTPSKKGRFMMLPPRTLPRNSEEEIDSSQLGEQFQDTLMPHTPTQRRLGITAFLDQEMEEVGTSQPDEVEMRIPSPSRSKRRQKTPKIVPSSQPLEDASIPQRTPRRKINAPANAWHPKDLSAGDVISPTPESGRRKGLTPRAALYRKDELELSPSTRARSTNTQSGQRVRFQNPQISQPLTPMKLLVQSSERIPTGRSDGGSQFPTEPTRLLNPTRAPGSQLQYYNNPPSSQLSPPRDRNFIIKSSSHPQPDGDDNDDNNDDDDDDDDNNDTSKDVNDSDDDDDEGGMGPKAVPPHNEMRKRPSPWPTSTPPQPNFTGTQDRPHTFHDLQLDNPDVKENRLRPSRDNDLPPSDPEESDEDEYEQAPSSQTEPEPSQYRVLTQPSQTQQPESPGSIYRASQHDSSQTEPPLTQDYVATVFEDPSDDERDQDTRTPRSSAASKRDADVESDGSVTEPETSPPPEDNVLPALFTGAASSSHDESGRYRRTSQAYPRLVRDDDEQSDGSITEPESPEETQNDVLPALPTGAPPVGRSASPSGESQQMQDPPQWVVDEDEAFWHSAYEKINLARQVWAYIKQVRASSRASGADTLPGFPGDILRNYPDIDEDDPPPLELLKELANHPDHRQLADMPELKHDAKGLPPVQLVDFLYGNPEDEHWKEPPSPVLRAWDRHYLT